MSIDLEPREELLLCLRLRRIWGQGGAPGQHRAESTQGSVVQLPGLVPPTPINTESLFPHL